MQPSLLFYPLSAAVFPVFSPPETLLGGCVPESGGLRGQPSSLIISVFNNNNEHVHDDGICSSSCTHPLPDFHPSFHEPTHTFPLVVVVCPSDFRPTQSTVTSVNASTAVRRLSTKAVPAPQRPAQRDSPPPPSPVPQQDAEQLQPSSLQLRLE